MGGFSIILIFFSSSCTQNEEEQVVSNKNQAISTFFQEYDASFVAKFGKPSPNQTWDFSDRVERDDIDVLPYEVGTRAISSAAVTGAFEGYGLEPNNDIQIMGLQPVVTLNELAYIRYYEPTLKVKDWTEEQIYGINDMWVWYVHGFEGQETELVTEDNPYGDATYSLGIHVLESGTGSYNAGTEYFTSLPIMGTARTNGWYGGSSYAGGPGFRINASALKNNENYSNIYWFAMVDDGTDVTSLEGDVEFRPKWELKTFKEYITPMGAVYWLFDCNHDGDYTDLVCLVEPVVAAKRYLLEDVGTAYDFDFNDIVVDVRDNGVKQTAVVRAVGGTLDFKLTIGDKTWQKSSEFNKNTAYNVAPGSIDYNATLTTIDVEGWDPLENNIKVEVFSNLLKNNTSETVNVTFPFPKQGEVPHIIAIRPAQTFATDDGAIPWMPEQVPIPDELWTE